MAAILGMNAKLYYQTTGTRVAWPGTGAAPNLAEIDNVKSLDLSLSKGEADVTTRGNDGWKATVGTLKDASIEFEMIFDAADTAFTAIQAAFLAGTTVAFAALTGGSTVEDVQGLWADCVVTGFDVSQPLEEAITVKVTIKPTYSGLAPAWITVGV
jgi:hypothetical protein